MKKHSTHIIFTALLAGIIVFFASYKQPANTNERLAFQQTSWQ